MNAQNAFAAVAFPHGVQGASQPPFEDASVTLPT